MVGRVSVGSGDGDSSAAAWKTSSWMRLPKGWTVERYWRLASNGRLWPPSGLPLVPFIVSPSTVPSYRRVNSPLGVDMVMVKENLPSANLPSLISTLRAVFTHSHSRSSASAPGVPRTGAAPR